MYQPASIFVSPATAAKPPPRCRQAEERSRQYEEETSVIMKTEELRRCTRNAKKEEKTTSIKTGKTCEAVRAGQKYIKLYVQ